MGKDWSEMTLVELRVEHAYWDMVISEATSWGAHLAAADEFRRGCERMIASREREASTPTDSRAAASVHKEG